MKQAAKDIHDAYAKKLKEHKALTITHKSFAEDCLVTVSISGTATAVAAAEKSLKLESGDMPIEAPTGSIIHSLRTDTHDGAKGDKDAETPRILTLYHTVTTN